MKGIPVLLLVLVIVQVIPLASASDTGSLPNLRIREQWWKDSFALWGDQANGGYNVSYRIENKGDACADASNTTINITIVSENGSLSSVISDPVPQLNATEGYDSTIGPFTCSCLRCVLIEICADGGNVIPESNENDNCKGESIDCPASACKPDLKIEGYAIGWINRSDGIFGVTYTVANIGNGDAGNSTTRVNGANDTVPALSAGENYSGTAGPFLMSGYETAIEICADYYDSVSESNEGNNCCSGTFGIPDLFIYIVSKDWADALNRTYNITCAVCNYGGAESGNATVSVYIDGNLSTSTAPHTVQGVQAGRCVEKTLGTFAMTGDNDAIRLCVEWDGGRRCDESTFTYSGCLATDGSGKLFTCGDRVDRSCTFTGDMCCDTRHSGKEYPHGLIIGADDITIDGCGYAMVGDRSACSKQYAGGGYIAWTGIRGGGYRNITIRNLEVRNFCNGIFLTDADDITIKDCNIRDNGAAVQYNCGITVVNSSYTLIDGCSVSNNTGILTGGTGCGGHGIAFAGSGSNCSVRNSSIIHNYHSGIYAPAICKYLNITGNLIEDNGYCGSGSGSSDFCTGINLDWEVGHDKTTYSAVSKNRIQSNTGTGIRVAQGYTTITDNIVSGCRNGTGVIGDGIRIDGGRITFLYNNTVCGNEGTDIIDTANESSTFGDDNTCDTTNNYNDEGTSGCIFYCGGANGVCVGKTYNFSCGMVVNESCTFNRSMKCLSTGGLIAGADDITIDGAGYTIIGNLTGIGIFSNRTNVAVQNLQVAGFSTGIRVENATGSTIENCNLRKNLLCGINLTADYGTVRNSRIYDNRGTGIVVSGSYNLFLNDTVVRNTGYGIYFSPCATNNTINTSAIGDNGAGDINNCENSTDRTNIGDENTCDATNKYRDGSPDGTIYGCTYPWTPPDLIITWKREEWVNHTGKRYNVSYRIKNDRGRSREAYPSMTYLHIDDKYRCIAEDQVGTLGPGDTATETFDYEHEMSDDDWDRIWVCADGADDVLENNAADIFYHKVGFGNYTVRELRVDHEANNCRLNTLEHEYIPPSDADAACVADDGSGDAYRCGDTVITSCTFNGNMGCPAGCGLIIGAADITIDGNGSAIIGSVTCADCGYASEEAPSEASGIYNEKHDGVTIKDLEVVGFCTGIALKGVHGDPVRNNLIEGCKIHDNGFDTESGGSETKTHGIHLCYASETTIQDNEVYRNSGTGAMCDGGGNGIFIYAGGSSYGGNVITGNELRDNDKAGFWGKRGMRNNEITHNTVYRNGNGPGVTDDVKGGIVLRCGTSNCNTITDNIVNENYGDGMFIGSGENTISRNTVNDNAWNGIDMGRSDGSHNNELYENTVCGNGAEEGCDIAVYGPGSGTTGDENTCDTTAHYHDASVDAGCTYRCGSKPDFIISDVTAEWADPDDPDAGYRIAYTIENIGNANASDIPVRIYVDGDREHDMIILELGADESHTVTVPDTFTMPGTRVEIKVCADHTSSIDEFDEDNNCLTDEWYALPDLIVTGIGVPGEVSTILPNDATATIKNDGTVETKEQFDVTLFVNGDHAETAKVPSNLAVGRSVNVTLIWTSALKSNDLRVFADSGGAIEESDEANNNMTTSAGENGGNGTGEGPGGSDPHRYDRNGVPVEDLIQPGEVNMGEGAGGDWDYDETTGNENASGRVSNERVHAQLFRSNQFFGEVKEVVVSHRWWSVAIASLLLLLFYFGYRGEIKVHKRNGR